MPVSRLAAHAVPVLDEHEPVAGKLTALFGRSASRDVFDARCRESLSMLLPLRPEETDFVAAVNDRGEIVPDFLTADPDLRQRIRSRHALEWRALQSRTRPGS